jgi:polysaccharide biosynthesis protein PslG
MLLAIVAGAVVGLVISGCSSRPSGAPVDARAAAIGNGSFDRAAARCRPTPNGGRPAAAQQTSLLLGLNAAIRLFPGRARCEEASLAQATGVQAVRDDLSWAVTEAQPNRYNWSNFDELMATATADGMLVLPVLDDSPAWAAPTGSSLPSSVGAYAAFVAAAVARYGPGGTFWRAHPRLHAHPVMWYELWNEPYFADHNRNPAMYARLVRAAVTAGRAANPAARFLIEADASYQTLAGGRADWIGGMYAAVPNLGRYFDGVAVHPYGGDPAIYTPDGNTDGQPGRIEQVHIELVAHGDGDKPLWVTEIGWSTCSGTDLCVSEAQQAAYLRSFLRLAHTTWSSYVRAVFVYALRDLAPAPRNNRLDWFGLLRPDLTRKPAWWVLHDAASEPQ